MKTIIAIGIMIFVLGVAAGAAAATAVQPQSGNTPGAAGGNNSDDSALKLANRYREQSRVFTQKAADERSEWERRSRIVAGVAQKYPRPVDSARYLYEYYTLKASEAAALASRYGKAHDAQESH